MRTFRSLQHAKSYANRCKGIAQVFDGPDGGFIVAVTGRAASELRAFGLKSIGW